MEHNDREYTDMLNNELNNIEPGAGLHTKVRDRIARNAVRVRRRNTALGAVAIAIVLTMALSTVTPVFGRNGTLPQVITAMAAERQAKKMSKTLGTASVQQTDSILALVIANQSHTPKADVLKLRADGLGWGRIMAQLKVSGRDIGNAMSQVKGQGENSKPAVSNTDGNKIVVNGEITGVLITSPITSSITVADKTFAIVPATQLKYHGKAITPAEIADKLSAPGKLYATVQGTTLTDGTTLRANLITVQDGASNEQTNPSNELTNPSNERAAVSNEQQVRGKVTIVTATTPTTLHIDGFAHDIVINADTKVEQVGAGTVDLSAIKAGQTVQVHVRVSLSDGAYLAQQVHIEDKSADDEGPTNPSVTTWQGTIAVIFPDKSITLTTEANPLLVIRITATSVLQDTSHKALLFTTLKVGQKVTIMGRTLTDNSVEVVKLIVTTITGANPNKGNGKD